MDCGAMMEQPSLPREQRTCYVLACARTKCLDCCGLHFLQHVSCGHDARLGSFTQQSSRLEVRHVCCRGGGRDARPRIAERSLHCNHTKHEIMNELMCMLRAHAARVVRSACG